MELIFFTRPIIGIIALVVIMLDFLCYFNIKNTILTIINIALHCICLTLIMLYGGGYEEALILVLVSAVITLSRTVLSNKNESEDEK